MRDLLYRNFWPSRLASVIISEAMSSASPALPVRIIGATERGMRPADSARQAAGPAAKAQWEASCRVADTPSAVSSTVVSATGMMRVKSKPGSLKVKWKMPPDQVGLQVQRGQHGVHAVGAAYGWSVRPRLVQRARWRATESSSAA